MSADNLNHLCRDIADKARSAALRLAVVDTAAKNAWLRRCANAVVSLADSILDANTRDVTAAEAAGLSSANLDRLRLTPARIASAAAGLRDVAALPDPVGEVRESSNRPNGLRVSKVGVPLGVIFFIYESRPNVTIDAAALCVKSGNAVILRGGKEAMHSNAAIHAILSECLAAEGLPAEAAQLVTTTDRAAVSSFLKMGDAIDLVIPRGGEDLIRRVAAEATMPVLKHYQGICHVYVEASADLVAAEAIVVNAKTHRPGVCNAAETLLVDAAVAPTFLPRLGATLASLGVEIRGCDRTRDILPGAKAATEKDFDTEHLALILNVRVVDGYEDAAAHIARHGSKHSDAIVTTNQALAERFVKETDSAAVLVNASTRFNDGYELGLGAEIGISTDKFHARGPCGLRELTSYKYVVRGEGHVRG